ncbi:unnamed protein product [Nezara viridula]|uniref:T-box domain-containing protein n=1 Tax=Nezara viridula TaxID=85310 RepID=A0A9P0HKJ3_NEZVI|nr:unnamed protein product [Nezara viridula]
MTAVVESSHPNLVGASLQLKNAPLWKQFNEHTTEMIITKSGRRMFPSLRISISGLEPDTRYFLILETRLSEGKRYKFSAGTWSGIGPADPQPHPSTRIYIHPDSPSPGSAWMAQDILFQKAKLTNNTLDRSGNLVLTSMHKYQPYIHIVKASDILALDWSPSATFTFPETEFVAVTAYQNEKITELKINYNPFAKAFRENGQARTKRKIQAKQREEMRQDDENQSDDASSSGDKSDENLSPIKDLCKDRTRIANSNAPECETPKTTGAKRVCIKGEDDSGISVGSVTPPVEESVILPPPPPYYPPAFWPFPPYFPYPAFYYPPPFYPPPPPLLDLRPTDYSIKH